MKERKDLPDTVYETVPRGSDGAEHTSKRISSGISGMSFNPPLRPRRWRRTPGSTLSLGM